MSRQSRCTATIAAAASVVFCAPIAAAQEEQEPSIIRAEAFVGGMLDRFSADASKSYVNPEDAGEEQSVKPIAGIEMDYAFVRGGAWLAELAFFGQVIFGSRTLEQSCADDSSARCQSVPNREDFLEIIEASQTLEALGGVRYSPVSLNQGQTWPYLAFQAGFIRAVKASDDLVDNHFIGVGFEHRGGRLDGSFAELGWGRSQIFHDRQNRRLKVGTGLVYQPGLSLAANSTRSDIRLFGELWVDTDLGDHSDDVQIWFGLSFDLDQLVGTILGGHPPAEEKPTETGRR